MDVMQININVVVANTEELKQLVKNVAEIQKEYSCNCTLNVKIP